MRKLKIKISAKKDKTGFWTIAKQSLGVFTIKKGENTFEANDLEGYDCVKIGKLIYDIEKYENNIVTLSEKLEEDFGL